MHRTVEEILNPVSGLPQILQKAIGLSLTTSALSRTFSNFFFCSWVYSSTLLRGRDGRPLARRTVPLLYRSLPLPACSPYSLSPCQFIDSVLPTNHLFSHYGP